jgi:hypothetical protein
LGTVYLSEVKYLPLDNPSPGYPAVLNYTPIAVLLAILFAIRATQEHDRCRIPPTRIPEKGVGLHYSLFWRLSVS